MKRKRRHRKQKIRKKLACALVAFASIIVLFFLFYSFQNPSSDNLNQTFQFKAAVVDHLSLTFPNQTFVETATTFLEQAGFEVDYYPGEKVTVEFYRNLPAHGYGFIVLRVHSTAAELQGEEYTESPVCLFSSEPYSTNTHLTEQLTDQIVMVSYTMPQPPYYFGIMPEFVAQRMSGSFQDSIIIMMGCEGLNNTSMAEAFIDKGADVYISWNGMVSAPHTDQATTLLIQRLAVEKQTVKQAVDETMKAVGADPAYKSLLIYYPLEAGDYAIQNFIGNIISSNTTEINIKHRREEFGDF